MRANNLFLVGSAALLFFISGVLLTIGVRNYYSDKNSNGSDIEAVERQRNEDESVELSDYFEGYYSSDEDPGSYSENDPFREVCEQVDAEKGTTVVVSNIVCYK